MQLTCTCTLFIDILYIYMWAHARIISASHNLLYLCKILIEETMDQNSTHSILTCMYIYTCICAYNYDYVHVYTCFGTALHT